ncbi:class I SAM-dependent methyltransferase [Microvirga puerhi]|uniref:Class I SAM-dependent methyltransferase n=1 Tax=Microvirga puerhi TaxID=2876078 RepID=A0ABS7VMW3_9HYPH|nr:class I SAM-dependent methyltransferase [Microvirga puerhi]MBZ6076332.1 class I SAM-dependent methyltransferase [Microvirga puerhi]
MSDQGHKTLYGAPDLALFYDAVNRWDADFDYCMALAAEAKSVLDLGCGTGELASAIAQHLGIQRVTGVDPAAAMLDIARKRPGGDKVAWIEGDARSVRLGERFDLVVLTGHVFQVFLTPDDQRAVLATIAAHLDRGGRFIFDSRNLANGVKENRTRNDAMQRLNHPQLGEVEAWNVSSYDPRTRVLTYENGYRIISTGQEHSGSAKIHYTPQEELADMITSAGLVVEKWLGDWRGGPYHSGAKEIIPVGRLA